MHFITMEMRFMDKVHEKEKARKRELKIKNYSITAFNVNRYSSKWY